MQSNMWEKCSHSGEFGQFPAEEVHWSTVIFEVPIIPYQLCCAFVRNKCVSAVWIAVGFDYFLFQRVQGSVKS